MAMKRYCEDFILKDLQKKMVFIGGPRQVGKTTLSKKLCPNKSDYFNWDVDIDRISILNKRWLADSHIIIFDELHKYPRWKKWIKGVYDAKPSLQNYLVTGSARLDTYKKGGDSLLGRYHYWRLHPLTIDELPENMSLDDGYQRLLNLGGFPEPFLSGDERESRRWRRERFERIIREDIRDLENIRNIQLLSLFIDALRNRVGNLITLSNIARDLEISPKTAKNWVMLIEKMYLAFPIYPLATNIPRSILKPPKIYFFDNADVLCSDAAKLENLVATTLLKRAHFIEDYYGHRVNLNFIRDKDGREVDFAFSVDEKLEYLIEVKLSSSDISSNLKYYAEKLRPKKAIQLVANLQRPYEKNNILVTSPSEFFTKFNPAPWNTDYKNV